MKNYLKLTITRPNGQTFENPLKLSEVHLINQIVKENKSVTIELGQMDAKSYSLTFKL